MTQTPLLIGFVIMSLASLAIYAKGAHRGPLRGHTLIHAAVPFIAATAYLAMYLGVGNLIKPDDSITYVARYFDWLLTTPLLLAGVVSSAYLGARERDGQAGFVASIVTLDVMMIVTGLVASLALYGTIKWVFFAWSCVAFVGVLYLIWKPLAALSEASPAIGAAYRRNSGFLTVLWLIYPVVFAVGPEGIWAISDAATLWIILVLDVLAKVVYAFTSERNLRAALVHSGA
ncbi:bacteriorhodopsin [Pseudomonas coleopterorum]|jgi:bacteriorhodopsin|uniref:Bacteriorhodopsin n=2 Tax=Pseudomonas coleopterorum TaxID=1605838 RepID=A0AAJ6M006_9PSED|nr:bacteriorhodopsin [Pseudomonas coleopterorum]WNC10328.1 bacteriorhodopsin [Pseudomonas coleopterorum]SEE68279.1 Bacteriorhodopsin [Pseudomonas coleopterorum]